MEEHLWNKNSSSLMKSAFEVCLCSRRGEAREPCGLQLSMLEACTSCALPESEDSHDSLPFILQAQLAVFL